MIRTAATRLALAAFVAAVGVPAAAADRDGCRYAGLRGYHEASPGCPSRHAFFAEPAPGGLVFTSERGTWFWRETPHGAGARYQLVRVEPAAGVSGTMVRAAGHPAIGGTIVSRACGKGFVTLTPLRGSCAAPSAPAPASSGALPAQGRSTGGAVRAAPSTGAPRAGRLEAGQRLVIVAAAGRALAGFRFYRVRWPGGEGWQWGGLLCAEDATAPLPACRD